jgi:hypothetical protein
MDNRPRFPVYSSYYGNEGASSPLVMLTVYSSLESYHLEFIFIILVVFIREGELRTSYIRLLFRKFACTKFDVSCLLEYMEFSIKGHKGNIPNPDR